MKRPTTDGTDASPASRLDEEPATDRHLALSELASRFVHRGVVLACARHAAGVAAFAEHLSRGLDIPDAALLSVDESVHCFECSLIAAAALGEPDLLEQPTEAVPPWPPEVADRPREEHTEAFETPPTVGSAASSPAKVVISGKWPERNVLTAKPYLQEEPFCPVPVRLAIEHQGWRSIRFETEEPLDLGRLPDPVIKDGRFPVIVTTPWRAALEYAKGGAWHVPLPLAPQRTRIVTRRNSRLCDASGGGLCNEALIDKLPGSVIAVADNTSSYASRIILAARQGGGREEFVTVKQARRLTGANSESREKSRTVYLVKTPYFAMVEHLVNGVIDGFATVEPFPTLAQFRLGEMGWAEATLDDRCTAASGGFCCVIMTPADLRKPEHQEALDGLLRALIISICGLLKPGSEGRLIRRFSATLKSHGSPKAFPIDVIAKAAALSTLKHLTEHLLAEAPGRWAEVLVPELSIEAIRAEESALAPNLTGDDRRAYQQGQRAGRLVDPKRDLFDFSRARMIFAEVARSHELLPTATQLGERLTHLMEE
jgi:hypothetical protein